MRFPRLSSSTPRQWPTTRTLRQKVSPPRGSDDPPPRAGSEHDGITLHELRPISVAPEEARASCEVSAHAVTVMRGCRKKRFKAYPEEEWTRPSRASLGARTAHTPRGDTVIRRTAPGNIAPQAQQALAGTREPAQKVKQLVAERIKKVKQIVAQ